MPMVEAAKVTVEAEGAKVELYAMPKDFKNKDKPESPRKGYFVRGKIETKEGNIYSVQVMLMKREKNDKEKEDKE